MHLATAEDALAEITGFDAELATALDDFAARPGRRA